MEQSLITKIALVILAMVVITLLMGFYYQFEALLVRDRTIQYQRDTVIQGVFDKAHTKLFMILIPESRK
jgi:hypothetical protein